jgi:1,4-alpha-glucan branching enzyme
MAGVTTTAGPELPPLDGDTIAAVTQGRHAQPHSILGIHEVDGGHVIRAVRPLAASVTAIMADGTRVALSHLADGLWQGAVPGEHQAYKLEAVYTDGPAWEAEDPYRFAPTVGDLDLHLFGEGRHEELWRMLGATLRTVDGVDGSSFAVWAPHAQAVRVIGDFNSWNGIGHAMRRLDRTGVWELFVPGVAAGTAYKYELLTPNGQWVQRADPMARRTEVPPATASVVDDSAHVWGDGEWMRSRVDPHDQPMSVYELHVGSWRPGLSYRELADHLIEYLEDLAFTHVEFMPLAEHPYGGSWGYQVTGYYAPTSRYGHPDDLRYLINRLHRAGIGVIVDWVPAHFPKDEWALANFDGQPLYEHSDPRRGEQPDWGTLVFDFGQSQVRNFLVSNALYWLEEFHIDGLRVDAVASMLYLDYSRDEWLPNVHGGNENYEAISLLQEVNATAYKRNPGIVMIAEESTSFPAVTGPTASGGLGFGLKWNMGWMHDTLQYMKVDPMYRAHHHHDITFSFQYAFSENFISPISHDEVVHGKGSLLGKMPGDQWHKLANVRAYLAFMWAHPGKQLLFMGQEFGQPSEWSEERGLDWWILDQPVHQGLHRLVGQLNRVYRAESAMWSLDDDPRGFGWLVRSDATNNVVAFLRWSKDGSPIAVLINFSGVAVGPYRVGLPFAGAWDEVINTDAAEYGGSGVGNLGTVTATEHPSHGMPASTELTLPPLATLWLKPRS